nr:MAG TPA: hypothetical protein [Caudoviricetes sp.]
MQKLPLFLNFEKNKNILSKTLAFYIKICYYTYVRGR